MSEQSHDVNRQFWLAFHLEDQLQVASLFFNSICLVCSLLRKNSLRALSPA